MYYYFYYVLLLLLLLLLLFPVLLDQLVFTEDLQNLSQKLLLQSLNYI